MEKKHKPKIIVTIPALNEERSIGEVIRSIPRKLAGIGKVEVLVWDDGSTDKTMIEAKKAGATYVFANKRNLGLARTFARASKKAIELGADIVVSTDADNQYDQQEISKLIKPILEDRADLVSGDRQVDKLKHMTDVKRYGNIWGTRVVSMMAGVPITDASSGFRAYTAEVLGSMTLMSAHTYTHETLIQAARNGYQILEIPVKFRQRQWGESRLITGVWQHVKLSAATIMRTLLMYEAYTILLKIGAGFIAVGGLGLARFGYFFATGTGSGHVQSLILASILIGLGFNIVAVGIIADLIRINRKLIRNVQ